MDGSSVSPSTIRMSLYYWLLLDQGNLSVPARTESDAGQHHSVLQGSSFIYYSISVSRSGYINLFSVIPLILPRSLQVKYLFVSDGGWVRGALWRHGMFELHELMAQWCL